MLSGEDSNCFPNEVSDYGSSGTNKTVHLISRAMCNEPPCPAQLSCRCTTGFQAQPARKVCSSTDPHQILSFPPYKGGKFPSTRLAQLCSHHRQSRPTVSGFEVLILRLTGRYVIANTQRDKSLHAV